MLYNATPQEIEQQTKETGTGYPSIDRPWLSYYDKGADTAPLPELSLYEYLVLNNKRNLDRNALNYMGRTITFRELFKRIDEASRAFRAYGVKEGDIVSIITVASVPSVVAFYALNKIGAVVDFVNVLATAKDMVKFFRSNRSRLVVSADIFVHKVLLAAKAMGLERVITFSLEDDLPFFKKLGSRFGNKEGVDSSYLQDPMVLTWDRFLNASSKATEVAYTKDPTTPALLAHTGGTTGSPKSVLLSDIALNSVVFQYHMIYHPAPDSVFLNLVVPFVVYGSLINLHMPLALRCCVALVPNFDPEDWPEYFNRYKPNYITAIPAYFGPMLHNPRMRNVNLENLKVVAVGGESIGNALETDINKFLKAHGCRVKLTKGYGMTELSTTAATCFGKINALGSVGIPLPQNRVLIYNNETELECKYNEIGEVCFQSPGQMIGYMDDEKEMDNVLRSHSDGSVWLHTGDLGYMNRKGMLHIVGRIKRVILTQYKGTAYRVYPNVVEEILLEHPAVQSACVVRLSDDPRGRTKAYVALHDHNRVNEAELEKELRSYCDAEMADYMKPYIYEFRGSLPMTPAGKVDYKFLESQTEGLG